MGRIVGIDFGLKRIGLAQSDPMKIIASPLPTLIAKETTEKTVGAILEMTEDVELFVVGLPLGLSGKDTEMTTKARVFAEKLEEISNIRVVLWDERLTSALAEGEMKRAGLNRKKRAGSSDKIAALIILQSYLEKNG